MQQISKIISNAYKNDAQDITWYEPWCTLAVKKLVKPDMCCINIGANQGWFTILLALCAGPKGTVIALEPLPNIFIKLDELARYASRINKDIAPIHTYNIGVSDKIEENKQIHLKGPGFILRPGPAPDNTYTELKLNFTTLDTLYSAYNKRLDFLFVDIDGSEVKFLRGAKKTLDKYKPTAIIEFGHQESVVISGTHEEAFDILRSCGYNKFQSCRFVDLDTKNLPIPVMSGVNVICSAE